MSIIAYIAIFILLWVSEALYLPAAARAGFVARQCARSSHSVPAVLGGGVVYYLSVLLFSAFSGMIYPGLFIGATLLSAVSFADDMRPLGVSLRMTMQFVAVGCVAIGLVLPPEVTVWGGILLAVCAVGFLNAWNFMDGINGLTGAYTALTLGALLYIDYNWPMFVSPGYLATGIMASAVFMAFNFRRRALCFAGDVGSLCAGAMVLFPLVRLMSTTDSLMWLGLVAAYGVDTVLTIVRRICLGQNIFHAHRMHLYQYLANECGFGHLRVAAAYVVVQAVINVGLVLWKGNPYVYLGAVLAVLTAAYFALLRHRCDKNI